MTCRCTLQKLSRPILNRPIPEFTVKAQQHAVLLISNENDNEKDCILLDEKKKENEGNGKN